MLIFLQRIPMNYHLERAVHIVLYCVSYPFSSFVFSYLPKYTEDNSMFPFLVVKLARY